tara:strand:+ start:376 stop:792 length:417 start_codon:yes stop_codon:yes gene_type:complete
MAPRVKNIEYTEQELAHAVTQHYAEGDFVKAAEEPSDDVAQQEELKDLITDVADAVSRVVGPIGIPSPERVEEVEQKNLTKTLPQEPQGYLSYVLNGTLYAAFRAVDAIVIAAEATGLKSSTGSQISNDVGDYFSQNF